MYNYITNYYPIINFMFIYINVLLMSLSNCYLKVGWWEREREEGRKRIVCVRTLKIETRNILSSFFQVWKWSEIDHLLLIQFPSFWRIIFLLYLFPIIVPKFISWGMRDADDECSWRLSRMMMMSKVVSHEIQGILISFYFMSNK